MKIGNFPAIMADRNTWSRDYKTAGDKNLVLVAVQKSRRISRKGRTKYVYSLQGTHMMYWNRSRSGVVFYPMGYDDRSMRLYHSVFCGNSRTEKEREWLKRYDYEAVG